MSGRRASSAWQAGPGAAAMPARCEQARAAKAGADPREQGFRPRAPQSAAPEPTRYDWPRRARAAAKAAPAADAKLRPHAWEDEAAGTAWAFPFPGEPPGPEHPARAMQRLPKRKFSQAPVPARALPVRAAASSMTAHAPSPEALAGAPMASSLRVPALLAARPLLPMCLSCAPSCHVRPCRRHRPQGDAHGCGSRHCHRTNGALPRSLRPRRSSWSVSFSRSPQIRGVDRE